MPTPEEITRHHEGGVVVHVDARPTSYTLRVAEWDPAWVRRYAELEAALRAALGDRLLEVHHVGSTAVPGLPAKPIVDVDLVVADPADEPAYAPVLRDLGYVHWLTEPDWHQHRLFKQLGEPRVHLHVFGRDCPEVVRHRMFRDWLTDHEADRERYARAKREAAAQVTATEEDHGELGVGMRYNRVKEPVVREIYDQMFRAAGLLP